MPAISAPVIQNLFANSSCGVSARKSEGGLQINFTGNGGVTDIILDEKRRMSEEKEDTPY